MEAEHARQTLKSGEKHDVSVDENTKRQAPRRRDSGVCKSIPTANTQFIRPFDLGAPTFGHIPAIVNSPDSGQNRQIAGKRHI
jgi:hypothetical protein